VISLSRPDVELVERYRLERLDDPTTCSPSREPLTGFRRGTATIVIGQGDATFERARRGLEAWAAHRGAGVEIFPAAAELRVGEVVALVTRQLGLWVLASCRVESTEDDPSRFGFTYATLPDHPACGYESFTVCRTGNDVTFEIGVVSRPGIPLARLGRPVTRLLQKRATGAYLNALKSWTTDR